MTDLIVCIRRNGEDRDLAHLTAVHVVQNDRRLMISFQPHESARLSAGRRWKHGQVVSEAEALARLVKFAGPFLRVIAFRTYQASTYLRQAAERCNSSLDLSAEPLSVEQLAHWCSMLGEWAPAETPGLSAWCQHLDITVTDKAGPFGEVYATRGVLYRLETMMADDAMRRVQAAFAEPADNESVGL